jgi:hypothetical protein
MLSKIAILEGSTLLLLLFLAVPAKRLFGYPEAVSKRFNQFMLQYQWNLNSGHEHHFNREQ